MLSWLGAKLIRSNMSKLNAGKVKPTLRLDAPDVELTFPGRSSFSGTFKGKPALQAWLERFAELGLQIFADEVVLKGFPWRQTVCVRGHDYLEHEGERVYENRYVIWGQLRWGRLKRYEVYEDTEAPLALDEWLARHGRSLPKAA
jgi:ketosteroid isomerase-like protein